MTDLAYQLDLMLRRYAADCDKENDGRPWVRFRMELRSLIDAYGAKAVDAALDEMDDGRLSPSLVH